MNLFLRTIVTATCAALLLICSGCGNGSTDENTDETMPGTASSPSQLTGEELTEDTVIAVVNGKEVKADTLLKMLGYYNSLYMQQTGQPMPQQQRMQMRNQLIEQIVTEEAVKQKVAEAKIDVPEEDVQKRINAIKGQFTNATEFTEVLAESGYTEDEFLNDLRQEVKAQTLMMQEMGLSTVTVQEAETFYNENTNAFVVPDTVEVSHILLEVPPTASQATQDVIEAKLKKIRADIVDGTLTFEEAAQMYSDCSTAMRGGHIGIIGKDEEAVSELFSDAAFSADVSNVTDVVDTEYGKHLIYVTQKDSARTASFDEVKIRLMSVLSQERFKEASTQWKRGIRAAADVEYK